MARWFVDGRWTKHMPSVVKEMLLSRGLVPPKVGKGSLGLVHWSAHDPSKWASKHAQALIDFMSLMYEQEVPEEHAAWKFHMLEGQTLQELDAPNGHWRADYGAAVDGGPPYGMEEAMGDALRAKVAPMLEMHDMEKALRVAERANRGPIAWNKARKAHEFEVKAYGAKPIKWPSWNAVEYGTGVTEAIDSLGESPERLNKRLAKIAKKQARKLARIEPTPSKEALREALALEALLEEESVVSPGGRKAQLEAARGEIAAGNAMAAQLDAAADEAAAGGTRAGFRERIRQWYAKNKDLLGGEEGAVDPRMLGFKPEGKWALPQPGDKLYSPDRQSLPPSVFHRIFKGNDASIPDDVLRYYSQEILDQIDRWDDGYRENPATGDWLDYEDAMDDPDYRRLQETRARIQGRLSASDPRSTLRSIAAGDANLSSFHGISPERAGQMLETAEGMSDPVGRNQRTRELGEAFTRANPDMDPSQRGTPEFKRRIREFIAANPELFSEEGMAGMSRRSFLGRMLAGAAAAKGLSGAKLPAAGGPRAAPRAQGLADMPPSAPEYFPRNALGHPMRAPRNQTGTPWGERWRDFAGLYPPGDVPTDEMLQRQWAEWHWRNTAPTAIGGNLPDTLGAWSLEDLAGPQRNAHVAADQQALLARLFSKHPAAKERAASEAAWALNEARIKAEWAAEDARAIQEAGAPPKPSPRAQPRPTSAFTNQPVPEMPGGRGPRRVGMPVSPEFQPPVRFRGDNVGDASRGLLSAADYRAPTSGAALRRLAAMGLGELGGAALGYGLMPEEETMLEHTRGTEDFVSSALGLPRRSQMPMYSLPPDRKAAVEAVEGMVGFRPAPEMLRSRLGDVSYPDWGADPITKEERRLYLSELDRLGEPLPEWAERTADVRPRREKPRSWEAAPSETPKPTGRAWDTFWEEQYPSEPGRDAVLRRAYPAEDYIDVEDDQGGWMRVLL